MILSDNDIRARVLAGELPIAPFRENNLQPASLDVCLSNNYLVYKRYDPQSHFISALSPHQAQTLYIEPGDFVLAATEEYVEIPLDLVARLEGKSTWARRGLLVHATAGFIDPGFRGFITLEMTSFMPIALEAGKPIGQLSFHKLASPSTGYKGKYQDAPPGPTPAR